VTAAAIDGHLLLRVLLTALVAGVGVSVVFALAVLGLARSAELRREERSAAAAGYAALGAAGLLVTGALIVLGLVLLAHKG
jgi:hypothetical protein